MVDFLKFIATCFIALSLLVGSVFGISYTIGLYNCTGYEKATGRATKYINGQCYGLIDGIWYDSWEYNDVFVAKRIKLEN